MKKTTKIIVPLALSALMLGSTVATVPVYAQNEPIEGKTVASKQEMTMKLEQTGSIYDIRNRLKVTFGPSNRQSTGVYKNSNDVIEIYVDPNTDQSVMPQYVISPTVLKSHTDVGRDSGIPLQKGWNFIREGAGIIHLINESGPTQKPATVTISGGQELPRFILGKHTDADWEKMKLSNPNAPGFELVSKHVIITGGNKSMSLVHSPNELMKAHDEAIEEENRVAGLDSSKDVHQPAPMKHHMREKDSGGWMYAWLQHTGYVSNAMKYILNPDIFKRDGWGPWHEVGHTHQMNILNWSGLGEVTNNIYSMSVQRYFGNHSRLEEDKTYNKVFAYLEQTNKDYNKINDLFVKLAMFCQLDLAYGKDFYPSLHKAYRELNEWSGSDAVKQQRFIRLASRTANRNLTPFFEKWGLMVTQKTKQQLASLPHLEKKIWQYMDDMNGDVEPIDLIDSVVPTPIGLQATDIKANSVTLKWNSSESNAGIKGYEIYRNGTKVGVTSSTEYTDTDVQANTEYRYTIKAVDMKGNVSDPTNEIKVETKQESSSKYEQWNPSAAYQKGNRVQHKGIIYECVQGYQGKGDPNWIYALSLWMPIE
ncbi:M60 family metallopeptidase [Paenibacillus larvae]